MVHLPGSVPPGRTAPQIPESWSSAGSATMFPFGIVVHSPVPRSLAPSDSTSWQNTPLADTKPSRSSRCSCMPGLVPSTQRYAADAWLHVSSCVFPLHEIVPRNLETSQDFSGLYYLMCVHPPPDLTLTVFLLFGAFTRKVIVWKSPCFRVIVWKWGVIVWKSLSNRLKMGQQRIFITKTSLVTKTQFIFHDAYLTVM